jgi:hypothetical protein
MIIVANTGLIGAVIGAMVLVAFRKSELVRKDVAERVAKTPIPVLPELRSPATIGEIGVTPRSDAPQNLGGYTHANVAGLEGKYLCLRPAFSLAGIISAYLVTIRWEDAESCLIFEEQGRADATYTQRGRIFVPDGKPYMSLVTIERGAIRVIMVSRPVGGTSARGLIITLSNPCGMQFTPVSAAIVLKPISDAAPKLGLIRADSASYIPYLQELEAVTPDYGFFAVASRGSAAEEPRSIKPTEEEVRLSVVRGTPADGPSAAVLLGAARAAIYCRKSEIELNSPNVQSRPLAWPRPKAPELASRSPQGRKRPAKKSSSLFPVTH